MKPMVHTAPCFLLAILVLATLPSGQAENQISDANFWCNVTGPIEAACGASAQSSPADQDVCLAVSSVFPTLGCNQTYEQPHLENQSMARLLALEFAKMELVSPVGGWLIEFHDTFCQELSKLYEEECGDVTAAPVCVTIRSTWSDRCNPDEVSEHDDTSLTLENAVEIAIGLLFYFVISAFLQYKQFSYLPEAGAAVLIGVGCGMVLWLIDGGFSCEFDSEFFFNMLLPFIILEAGLCVDKRMLASNLGTIVTFASIGTLISSFVVGVLVYLAAGFIGQALPLLECLIFGSLISSIDPIATLSVFSNFGVDKSLYILVFGESMLNDGVAVVLFQGLLGLLGKQVDGGAIGELVLKFVECVMGSVLSGAIMALVSAYLFRIAHGKVVSHEAEVLLFLLCALIPYYVSDSLGWSGIVSIMTAGVLMDVYTIKNLSGSARISILSFVQIASSVSNAIIFMYMGIQIVGNTGEFEINLLLGCITIVICLVARLWVFPLASMCNCFRPTKYPVSLRNQLVLFYSGLRGVVSYALATAIPGYASVTGQGSRYRAEIMGLTIFVICVKMFLFGGLTLPMLKAVGIPLGEEAEADAADVLDGHKSSRPSEHCQPDGGCNKLSSVSTESFFQLNEDGDLEPRHWIHTKYLAPLLLVGKKATTESHDNTTSRHKSRQLDLEGAPACCGVDQTERTDAVVCQFEQEDEELGNEAFEVYRRRPVQHRSHTQRHNFISELHRSGQQLHGHRTFDESIVANYNHSNLTQDRHSSALP